MILWFTESIWVQRGMGERGTSAHKNPRSVHIPLTSISGNTALKMVSSFILLLGWMWLLSWPVQQEQQHGGDEHQHCEGGIDIFVHKHNYPRSRSDIGHLCMKYHFLVLDTGFFFSFAPFFVLFKNSSLGFLRGSFQKKNVVFCVRIWALLQLRACNDEDLMQIKWIFHLSREVFTAH